MSYSYNELNAMAHKRVKKLAMAKCKQKGIKSSWVQSVHKDELITFLVEGTQPKQTPKPT